LLASFNIAKVSQAETYQNKGILQPFVDFAESNLLLAATSINFPSL